MPPMHTIALIHEASSSVIAPLSNGDKSLDCKIGKNGDTQPIIEPWENVKIFTGNKINKIFIWI